MSNCIYCATNLENNATILELILMQTHSMCQSLFLMAGMKIRILRAYHDPKTLFDRVTVLLTLFSSCRSNYIVVELFYLPSTHVEHLYLANKINTIYKSSIAKAKQTDYYTIVGLHACEKSINMNKSKT